MDSNKFPTQIYPKQYQALIEHLKKVSGFDTNLSSLAFLSASATSIGSSVQLKVNEAYYTKPILWCVLIGRSGIGKSHIMSFPFNYIQNRENLEWEEYEKLKSNLTEGETLSPPNDIILNDATMESIYKAHKSNQKGLVLSTDEINGWFKNFNKYNNGGGDKDTWLSLFDGKSLKVNRVSRETLHLSGTCINIIGGVQPERVNYFLSDENLVSGFYHRFLFTRVCEDVPILHNEEPFNKALIDNSNLIFESLFNIEPFTLEVPKDAKQLYLKWQNEKSLENFRNPFGERLQSKLQTYIWRFCIILDVLDQVCTDKRRTEITPETMENAITLAEYFRAESLGVYEESFNEVFLEGEPVEFQKIYRKLENREYSTAELLEAFSSVWVQSNIHKKLKEKELFTKRRHGYYTKTITDVKK